MKNIQKGFIGIALIIIITFALVAGGTYFVTKKQKKGIEITTETKTSVIEKLPIGRWVGISKPVSETVYMFDSNNTFSYIDEHKEISTGTLSVFHDLSTENLTMPKTGSGEPIFDQPYINSWGNTFLKLQFKNRVEYFAFVLSDNDQKLELVDLNRGDIMFYVKE